MIHRYYCPITLRFYVIHWNQTKLGYIRFETLGGVKHEVLNDYDYQTKLICFWEIDFRKSKSFFWEYLFSSLAINYTGTMRFQAAQCSLF